MVARTIPPQLLRQPAAEHAMKVLHLPENHADHPQQLPPDQQNEPFVLKHQTDSWPARTKWASPKDLKKHYGGVKFRVGSYAGVGGALQGGVEDVALGDFLDRLEAEENTEEHQPYLVEKDWHRRDQLAILEDYSAPSVFGENDLLAHVPRYSCLEFQRKPRTFIFLRHRYKNVAHAHPPLRPLPPHTRYVV